MPHRERYASAIEKRRKPLKDSDLASRAFLLKALGWLLFPAIGFSAALIYYFVKSGFNPLLALILGVAIGAGGPTLVFGIYYFVVVSRTVSLFGRIYFGGDTGTPPPDTFWRAQALTARGSHAEALNTYEEAVARDPSDPTPYLRAAALCSEELGDLESAANWYRRLTKMEGITLDMAAYASTRLADVYESLGAEGREMVELRRMLTIHPESQHAQRARARLAALKAGQAEHDDQPPDGPEGEAS